MNPKSLCGGLHKATLCEIEISVKGKWLHVPALDVDGRFLTIRGKWIRKAIVNAEEWWPSEVSDPELCIRSLKEHRTGAMQADIFTFSQKLPGSEPKYNYPFERISIAGLHIESYDQWWDGLPQVTRKNVRRSVKRGVVVSVKALDDVLIRDIVDLNNDSPVRQKVPFVHYGKSFEQVKKDQSTYVDRSDFICAYVGDKLIGFLKLVYKGEVASILQILPRASAQDQRPANALIAKAVEVCQARSVSYLTYGLFNYGNKRDSSLQEFKSRNGFVEMITPRFHIPLTLWGSMCVKTGLHKGLIGILPPTIITAGLKMRAAWYDRIMEMGRRSSMLEHPNCDRQMES
jgi:hypothetical protein